MPQQALTTKLHRRILIFSGVGMFIIGVTAAFIAIWPLLTQLRAAQERNLLLDLRAHIDGVEAYLARLKSSASLIGNRTRAGQPMQAYFAGQLSRKELVASVEEAVADRMSFSSNTVGIVVLDSQNVVLASGGVIAPAGLWPVLSSSSQEPALRGPLRIGKSTYMLAAAPITNAAAQRVGVSILTYRLTLLESTIRNYRDLGQTGEAIVGDPANKELPVFFTLRPSATTIDDDTEKVTLVKQALDAATAATEPALFERAKEVGSPWVMAYGPVKGARWGVVIAMARAELFGHVNRRLGWVLLSLLVLILVGIVGLIYILRPLSGRLLYHADELSAQIDAKTAQLNAELGERARAEEGLRDSEALYHSLVDTLPISILRKNLEGRIIFGNEGYCQMMGMSLDQLKGKSDWDLFPHELAEKYVGDDRRAIESREVFEDIEEHAKPNGERIFVHVLKAPVFNSHAEVVGTQIIFWDVTARRTAELNLEKTAAELARSNRELELFAYVASHDLQEPLRMITSYSQLLARRYKDKLDADAETFIHYAVDGAHRMQKLINDLLAYSRISTRTRPAEPVDANKTLTAVRANLKLALEEAGAQILCDPLPTVMADESQLLQLLQNLVSNALKFRSSAPPIIRITAARSTEPGKDDWVFRVSDNGIGIDPQYFERIFVIFQRLHSQQEYPGTGIGLAICKKIVERHGGRIWVESVPGQGSTFTFTLPSQPGPELEVAAEI